MTAIMQDTSTSDNEVELNLPPIQVRYPRRWAELINSKSSVVGCDAVFDFIAILTGYIQLEVGGGVALENVALAAFNAADYSVGGLSPDMHMLAVGLLSHHWAYGRRFAAWYTATH